MDSKFTFYDLLAHIIPGAIVITIGIYFIDITPFKNLLTPPKSIGNASIFVIFSYFIGQLIHAVSFVFQKLIFRRQSGRLPSIRFLRNEDKWYSMSFKSKLKQLLQQELSISFSADDKKDDQNNDQNDKQYDLAFKQAYSFVVDNRISEKPAMFNAIYGFYRALIVSCLISILILFGKGVWLFTLEEYWNGGFDAFLGLFFIIAGFICVRQARRKGEAFADSVYRSFYNYFVVKIRE